MSAHLAVRAAGTDPSKRDAHHAAHAAAPTEPAPFRSIPRPKGGVFLGNTLSVMRDPLGSFLEAARTHGEIVRFEMGPYDYVLLDSAEAVKHLLIDNAKNYRKSRSYDGLKLVLGEGLVTSEGDFWRKQRKLSQPAFHKERLSSFANMMVNDTASMLSRWSKASANEEMHRPTAHDRHHSPAQDRHSTAHDGHRRRDAAVTHGADAPHGIHGAHAPHEIDMHEEMMRLTYRIVARTLCSVDVDPEEGQSGSTSAHAIGEAIATALHFANDYAESIVRLPTWLPTPSNIRFRRAAKVLDSLVLGIIEERRRLLANASHASSASHASNAANAAGAPGDLLDLLMAARYDDGSGMSDRQLRDEIMTIVLAGHETTANALSWTWTLLSQHPDVARKVQAEVDEVLAGRAPTMTDLPKLRYVAMVVQESMRLYPPVWIFERQAIEDDVVSGFVIPKGTVVAVSPYVLHRNPRYWDNPEGFDPERFTAAAIERRPKHAYLPFSVGPRQCIGNAFAMMEAQIIVAMTVQRFRPSLVSGHRIEPDPKVTLRPKHKLPMTLHPSH